MYGCIGKGRFGFHMTVCLDVTAYLCMKSEVFTWLWFFVVIILLCLYF